MYTYVHSYLHSYCLQSALSASVVLNARLQHTHSVCQTVTAYYITETFKVKTADLCRFVHISEFFPLAAFISNLCCTMLFL